jgi:hypothetical protein
VGLLVMGLLRFSYMSSFTVTVHKGGLVAIATPQELGIPVFQINVEDEEMNIPGKIIIDGSKDPSEVTITAMDYFRRVLSESTNLTNSQRGRLLALLEEHKDMFLDSLNLSSEPLQTQTECHIETSLLETWYSNVY